MARTTANYGFNISEGGDHVNPLIDIFPNFEDIDTDLKGISDDGVGTATELLTSTVHAITRSDSDRDVIRFTATSNFTAGETFTVDGVQVTALTPDGQTLATGSYIIGSEVLAILKGTLLTVYVSPAKAKDSDLLDGHDSTYFGTASDVSQAQQDISDISSKVGTGVLTTTAQDCVGGINELNANLTTNKIAQSDVDIRLCTSASNAYECPTDGYVSLSNLDNDQNALIDCYVIDSRNEVITHFCKRFGSTTRMYDTFYVKKGMKLYLNDQSAGIYARFRPLIN